MPAETVQPALVPIGTVVETLQREYPDVSHSSLRFLEREGLVTPERTPGGHRLYSPADVERVRRIKEWQAQRLSLDDIRRKLAQLTALDSPDTLAERFLALALAGDLAAAGQCILEASDLGLPLETLFLEVLRSALWRLGDGWARGEISVAQEKEVSELARELIAELSLRHAREGAVGADVVAACVAGERHDLGLRMAGGLLRARGVNVHLLGADVEPGFLAEAVRRLRPRAVLLSVTRNEHLPAVAEALAALRGDEPAPLVLAGGQAVARRPEVVAGYGARPVTDGVAALEELIAGRAG